MVITVCLAWGMATMAEPHAGHTLIPAGKPAPSQFLIVADQATFEAAEKEIRAYKEVLEEEELGTLILTGDWDNPETLREEIRKIREGVPALEGVVFVGNIPIVRVQNFQHATTAFKMNEETFPLKDASVTTDRFYDDLDLEFERISVDEENPLIFYYRLKESSPQVIGSEFYSARMLPPSGMGSDQLTLLKKYLVKVVAAHREQNPLDRFVIFNGHGYNSDCLTAWQNEQLAIREQIPAAFTTSRGNGFYNFRQDPFMKFKLFNKLQEKGTDLFVFHEHGDYDTQYINGAFPAPNILEYPSGKVTGPMAALGISLRNSYRRYSGERADKFREETMTEYELTDAFFDPLALDSLRQGDSLFAANVNIVLEDLPKVRTEPRISIFDACYNGSFHQPGYIAGYHVFGEGGTIVAQGNTVNVLQDKWALELLGMLAEGARVGFWHKDIQYLETHLIGDPTFRFYCEGQEKLNRNLAQSAAKTRVWKKMVKSRQPNLQAIAIRQLAKSSPEDFDEFLLKVFRESPAYSVRMEALKRLLEYDGKCTVEAIRLGLDDPYEYIRRVAARYAGYSGDPQLIAPLVRIVLYAHESQRVQYAAQGSLEMFDTGEVVREIERHQAEGSVDLISYYQRRSAAQEKSLGAITDKSADPVQRINAIRSLRNFNNHQQVDRLLTVLGDSGNDPHVRTVLAEALGWFNLSTRKQQIVEALKKVEADDSETGELRVEATQSLIRLQ